MNSTVDAVAAEVRDPELPQLTIADLGILRHTTTRGDTAVVTITPTYTACPALETIRADIATALRTAGWREVEIHTVFAPAWTTDWITPRGRQKLAEAGISPPGASNEPSADAPAAGGRSRLPLAPPPPPRCPRCASHEVEQLSRFGPTACLALWRCLTCAEPFEHFKRH